MFKYIIIKLNRTASLLRPPSGSFSVYNRSSNTIFWLKFDRQIYIYSYNKKNELALTLSLFELLIFITNLSEMTNILRRWRGQNQHQVEPLDHDKLIEELRTAIGPLSGHASKFCTDGCLRRYLEARNWNLEKAKKMLVETLEWRSSYKPEEIRWDEVAHEGETGKVSRANFVDQYGRPVLIMRPGKQNTKTGDGNVRHLVYLIENAILNLPEGQEQMTWLIDFTGYSMNASNIQLKTTRDIMNVLQNHYPERLAIIILYNPPKIFQAFYKVISYLIDPKTYLKIKFVYPNDKASIELMNSCFDTENLPSEFGGKANLNLNYDHEEFSKLMFEDDIKNARFWEAESKPVFDTNGHHVAQSDQKADYC